MNPKNLHSSASLIRFGLASISLFIALMDLFVPLSATSVSMYESCKPVSCRKGPNITYPFYMIGHQDESCGYPNFGIKCQGDNPICTSARGDSYIIRNISDYGTSARFVNSATLNDSCPFPVLNSSFFDGNLMRVEAAEGSVISNLCFFYGCNFSSNSSSPPPKTATKIGCLSEARGIKSFVELADWRNQTLNWSSHCGSDVEAPVEVNNKQLSNLYQSTEAVDEIEYEELLKGGFTLRMTWTEDACKKCQTSGGRCGYNTTETRSVCHCPDGTHLLHCGKDKDSLGGFTYSLKLSLGLSFGIIGILFLGVILCSQRRRWMPLFSDRNLHSNQVIKDFIKHQGITLTSKRFAYSEVKRMTCAFKEKVGQGGFGAVYKGKLPDETFIAVKLLNSSKGNNGEEFINEVASISRTSHVNIVNLLGFCFEGRKRALIYEFMPNGSLDKFIRDNGTTDEQLGWDKLYQIAVGIARGLEYLHRGCNTRILHFDIKPHNILLDEDFCPKISDFGLSKLCLNRESIVSMMVARGTIGYIAPEVFSGNFGGVSHKSDVYSYGMMLMEMVGGRKKFDMGGDRSSEIYFPDRVYRLLEMRKDNLGLPGQRTTEENEIARKMIVVGLWCIQTDPTQRPSMSRVIEMLEGSTKSLQIPPKTQTFYPPVTTMDSFSSFGSSI